MDAAFADPERAALRPRVTGSPINALVLDDSKFDRQRLRRLSRETGLPIYLDEVGSLEALRELLDLDQFDVILIDYRLNAGDGIEALEMVRSHPRNAHVPAIIVTGIEDPAIAVKAMRLGCSDLLSKSDMTADTLAAAVASALTKSGSGLALDKHKQEIAQAVLTELREKLQPELAALVRAVRTLRASSAYDTAHLRGDLEQLEVRCVHLWSEFGKMGHARPH